MHYLDRYFNEQITATIKAYKEYINKPNFISKREFEAQFRDLGRMAIRQGYVKGGMETRLNNKNIEEIISIYLSMYKS